MTDPYNSSPTMPAGMPVIGDAMVTTAQALPGLRVVRSLGLVRGITVRSRSIVGNFFGGFLSKVGATTAIYTALC